MGARPRAHMVVEVHVPLLPMPGLPDGFYPFPWIEEAEGFGQGRRVTLAPAAV